MEAFSLLKYWRGTAGGAGFVAGGDGAAALRSTTATTTIVTAVSTRHAEEETDDDDDDDGPFFDLEFAVQDQDDEAEEDEDEDDGEEQVVARNNGSENDDVGSEDEITDEEREFNFTISSNSSGNDRTDQHLKLSPSDDLFFKGKLVPIEPSSLVFNSAEPNSKPQFPVSLLKSATKLRVSMLGFKKPKQNAAEKVSEKSNGPVAATAAAVVDTPPPPPPPPPKQQQKQEAEKDKQSKFFTVKFKVEEVPIMSLFTRDSNSSRKSQKHNAEDSEEKKFSKDVMQKYLKKVKPLYVRVSKLKFSGQLNSGSVTKSVHSTPSTAGQKPNQPKSTAEKSPLPEAEVGGETFVQLRSQKQANIPERLKVVCKHLGKSRSASSAVAAAPAGVTTSRRDDSLLQQQDGIQSAILHCKRSFNASRGTYYFL